MFIERAIARLDELPVPRRALAVNALARSLVHSGLSAEDYSRVEHALIRVLDDPSDIVRHAVSTALAGEETAPRSLVHLLANDRFFVAAPILKHSPVLTCAQLVDLVALGGEDVQAAIAARPWVSVSVAAAIGEIGGLEACLALLSNANADILEDTLRRIASRFGKNARMRETLLAWSDLPIDIRHDLMTDVAEALRGLVAGRNWMGEKRIDAVFGDATEKAVLKLFEEQSPENAVALVRHLYDTDRLTPKLLVRAAVTGNIIVLEAGLSVLSGQPQSRVFGMLMHGSAGTLKALLKRAGVGNSVAPLIVTSIEVYRQLVRETLTDDYRKLRRTMIERVMTRYETMPEAEADRILALLHRYAADAARDEARRAGHALPAPSRLQIAA